MLKEYRFKKDPIKKLGIIILDVLKIFPSTLSDHIIIFYLNNLRTKR
jgi:hypothetical protein